MEKAVILGAGPAGLTAAWELLTRTDIRPVILEAGAQVGGLSRTIDYKGNLIDIGGHRFFSKSDRILRWWLDFLPLNAAASSLPLAYQNRTALLDASPNAHAPYGHFLVRPRKSRIYFNHSFFDYPLSLTRATLGNFGVREIARIGASFARAKLMPLRPELSLEDFFVNRFGRRLYETFFKAYTEKIWGIACTEIPADWGRQRVKDLNIGKALRQAFVSLFRRDDPIARRGTSTSLIEQFLYPERGPGQLWEAVAARIAERGGEIRLGCRVDSLETEGSRVVAAAGTTADGSRFRVEGDHFFSGIPVRTLVRGLPGAPDRVASIASQLAYRDFIMVGLLLRKNSGTLSGLTDNWIYLQDRGLVAGRLQIFNNWSPHMVADADGTLWIGVEYFCAKTDPIWSMPDGDIASLARTEITSTGLIGPEELLDSTVIRVPKAYPSYTGAYRDFGVVREYLDGFENLFLTGRNGMHRYNNADHSMMTSMMAVDNLIDGRRDRANLWDVNMEDEYHETR